MATLVNKGLEYEEILPGQKIYYSTLTRERVEKMNSIGFVWNSNRRRQDFDELFQKLVEYKEENGDCMVKRGYQDKQVSFMMLTISYTRYW